MQLSSWLSVFVLIAPVLASGGSQPHASRNKSQPNIVVVMSDDQDRRLGSTDFQSILQHKVISKGTEYTNHFATVAQCCPSRASLLRGQAAHNTNITHVAAPGGNYDKWRLSGEDKDYLPFWLKRAGYRTEYIGKFLNGYTTQNYNITPKGWDHVDALVDPYTYSFNTVVMSANGQRPLAYLGYHQSDVIRAKVLDRLKHAINGPEPFFLQVAPASPHVSQEYDKPGGEVNIFPPVPLARHADLFTNAAAPRTPNYNPEQKYTEQKPSWLHDLRLMNDTEMECTDHAHRERARSLQGVDEIMEDMLDMLEANDELDNTYFIYTTDNGYHLGQHRATAGKATPYVEDTNLPFVVRGPGIPEGVLSSDPSTHIDLAPTFLEIAGLSKSEWPTFLDGRSLLDQWHGEGVKCPAERNDKDSVAAEVINIEFWGGNHFEGPAWNSNANNSYKTVRIIDQAASWYYAKWCEGPIDTELYNTRDDPYELTNLAINATRETQRLLDRLNALLLVTKSCTEGSCRNPWLIFEPHGEHRVIHSLATAMQSKYDDFFAALPDVQFGTCMNFQDVKNERPFYPPGAELLGEQYRQQIPYEQYNSDTSPDSSNYKVKRNVVNQGGWDQRHVKLSDIMDRTRPLTDWELENVVAAKRWTGDCLPA